MRDAPISGSRLSALGLLPPQEMTANRRDFLRVGAVTAGALAAGVRPASALAAAHPFARALDPLVPRGAPLKILILGGTNFIGPYQVQYALDRGHTITLFNRGKTNPALFPTVEKLIGDRNG